MKQSSNLRSGDHVPGACAGAPIKGGHGGTQYKGEFMAMLAHELRGPLAPIHQALYLIRLNYPGGSITRPLEVLERQVRHLTWLVDTLMDTARIGQGKIALHRERLDLAFLVHASVEDRRALFEAAGIEIHLAVPDDPVWVMGDAGRLSQVLANLLQNAVKFTSNGEQVHVCLGIELERQRAIVTIRDTGIGIETGMLPHVFEMFSQAPHSTIARTDGLGLGLALVKTFIELHGGEVWATSAGVGKGAELTFSIPLATVPTRFNERKGSSDANTQREEVRG